MKYIRNDKGIYFNFYNNALSSNTVYDDIIAQADTIEELCDEFVIVRKDDISTGGDLDTYEDMKSQRQCDIDWEVEEDYLYYGAIWTSKGLIYVAKMNESGILELL